MEIASLLNSLLSNNNDTRKTGERLLAEAKLHSPADLMSHLIAVVLTPSMDVSPRTMSCILLRGYAIREPQLWQAVDMKYYRNQLLAQVITESSSYIQRKTIDMLAPLAKLEDWPEVFSTVTLLSTSLESKAESRRLGLHLLNKLCEFVPQFVISNGDSVVSIIVPNLDHSDIGTQCHAVVALCSFLHEIDGSGAVGEVSEGQCSLLGKVPLILAHCIGSGLQSEAIDILQALLALANDNPCVFAHSWVPVLECLAQLCTAVDLDIDDNVKIAALEIGSTLLISKKASFMQTEATISTMLQICISFLPVIDESDSEIVDFLSGVPSEESNEFDDDEDIGALAASGSCCLQQLAEHLEPTAVLQVCLPLAGSLISSTTDWKSQRASLLILHLICRGACAEMYASLPHIMPQVLACIASDHPRVQYAALNCIFEFLSVFNGETLLSHHQQSVDDADDDSNDEKESQEEAKFMALQSIFPSEIPAAIWSYIQTANRFTRNLNLAVRCLRSFYNPDRCSKAACKTTAAPLLDFAVALYRDTSVHVSIRQELASLLCNVSILSPSKVLNARYSTILEAFKRVVNDGSGAPVGSWDPHDEYLLKGKSIEAFAILGKAIGKQKFAAAAMELVSFLVASHQQGLDFSNPMTTYIVQATARTATVFEDDFGPFLPLVLPPLLTMLKQPLEMEVLPEDGASNGSSGSDEDVMSDYKRGLGEIKVKFNSSQIIEKESGLRSLYQYLLDIPNLVWIYCPQIIDAVVHVIDFPLCNDELYHITCAIITESIKIFLDNFTPPPIDDVPSSEERSDFNIGAVCHVIISTCIQALGRGIDRCTSTSNHRDTPAYAVQLLFDGLRELLQVVYDHGRRWGITVAPDVAEVVLKAARDETVTWIHRRLIEGIKQQRNDDAAAEESIWMSIIDCCSWVIKINGSQLTTSEFFINEFLPYIQELLKNFSTFDDFSLQFPVCTLLDIVEYIGPLSESCGGLLAPVLFQRMDCDDLIVSGVFSIGLLAIHAPSALHSFRDFVTRVLYHTVGIRSEEGLFKTELDDDQELHVKDNAIAALLKVYIFAPELLPGADIGAIMPLVCSTLPLVNDLYEARTTHGILVDRVIASDPKVLGPNGEHVTNIIGFLVKVLMSVRLASVSVELSSTEFWLTQAVSEETFNKVIAVLKAGLSGASGLPAKVFTDALAMFPREIQIKVVAALAI